MLESGRGTSTSWRKSRLGRHLSSARKRVTLHTIGKHTHMNKMYLTFPIPIFLHLHNPIEGLPLGGRRVSDDGGELDVQVSGEPEGRLQLLEQELAGDTAQRLGLALL